MSDHTIQMKAPMPERFGKYPVEARIGQGGMGAGFLARHPDLDIPVAIKVLRPELAREDEQFALRFMQEARTAARLHHHNIVRVYDVGQEDDMMYLVMEYIKGGSARDLLQNGALGIDEALRITQEVADALVFAARHGVVHRDIKPDNILIDEEGNVRLSDLGIAKALGDASPHEGQSLTMTGMSLGTPHYMAPEQARNAKAADSRSDIYSLGATLYHLLSNQPPFSGESTVDVILKHCNDPLPDIRHIRPEIPDSVCDLIDRMMAKDPAQRHQSPSELVEDVSGIRNGKSANNKAFLINPTHATLPVAMPPKRTRPIGKILIFSGLALIVMLFGLILILVGLKKIKERQETISQKPGELHTAQSSNSPAAQVNPSQIVSSNSTVPQVNQPSGVTTAESPEIHNGNRANQATSSTDRIPRNSLVSRPGTGGGAPHSKELAKFDHEFVQDDKLTGWHFENRNYAEKLFISSEKLTLIPTASTWYQDQTGFFAYREIKGDFSMESQVTVSSKKGRGVPNSNYSLAGIMIRVNPDDGKGQNYVLAAIGKKSGFEWKREYKFTENNVSNHQFLPADSGTAELLLKRVGRHISVYSKEGGEWIEYFNAELRAASGKVQAGFFAIRDADKLEQAPSGDMKATFEYIRFDRLTE